MRNDIKNHLQVAQTLAPAARTATATGGGVDLANFDAAAVVFDVGTVTNDAFTFQLQESDDDGSTDAYAAVAAADLDGAYPDAPTADTVTVIGYHGIKRWIRVVATDGGTGDASFGVSVVRAKGRVKP